MKVEFDKIPDESRVWIYQSKDDFTESDFDIINKKSEIFVNNWMAHNKELQASYKIFNNRFLVIAVNEKFNPIGGCSIDYSLQLIKDISNSINKNLLDRLIVNYRMGSEIKSITLKDLKNNLKNGSISSETVIFNMIVSTKKELLNNFEIKLSSSWLSKFI
tara:strand:- start:513 stop:995 length:483 start_codon:yes stop_codon:yes gene_type:complete